MEELFRMMVIRAPDDQDSTRRIDIEHPEGENAETTWKEAAEALGEEQVSLESGQYVFANQLTELLNNDLGTNVRETVIRIFGNELGALVESDEWRAQKQKLSNSILYAKAKNRDDIRIDRLVYLYKAIQIVEEVCTVNDEEALNIPTILTAPLLLPGKVRTPKSPETPQIAFDNKITNSVADLLHKRLDFLKAIDELVDVDPNYLRESCVEEEEVEVSAPPRSRGFFRVLFRRLGFSSPPIEQPPPVKTQENAPVLQMTDTGISQLSETTQNVLNEVNIDPSAMSIESMTSSINKAIRSMEEQLSIIPDSLKIATLISGYQSGELLDVSSTFAFTPTEPSSISYLASIYN